MGTHQTLRCAPVMGLCLVLTGCIANTAVPDDASIGCAADEDCPAQYSCQTVIERCVPNDRADKDPPGIVPGSVEISSPVVSGGTVTVDFEVTEALYRDPVVLLTLATPAALTGAERDEAENNIYTFTYNVTGNEPETGPVGITASLVDLAGNEAPDVALGSIAFDFEAPEIVSVELVGNRWVRAGITAVIEVTLEEVTPAAPLCTLLPLGIELEAAAASAPPVYRFEYTATGDEAEAPHGVTVEATDAAGNARQTAADGLLAFDFTTPLVVPGSAMVLLDPGPGNPLPAVTALTVASTVTLRFMVDELGIPAPDVIASDGAEELVFELLSEVTVIDGVEYRYQETIGATVVDGLYTVIISANDDAGNQSVTPLTEQLTVDTVAPSAPDVDSPGRITHVRGPWGTNASAGVPSYAIVGGPGATDGGNEVLAIAGFGAELGRGTAVSDGSFDFDLAAIDLDEVQVIAVDRAGNASVGASVRDVRWIATMGGKVPGSNVENPHHFYELPRIRPPLAGAVGPGAVEVSGGALGVSDTNWIQTNVGGLWTRRELEVGRPGPRILAAGAYDAARGRTILFGGSRSPDCGENGGAVCGFTWSWHDHRWWLDAADSGPQARSSHVTVYDTRRDRTVLFGGVPSQTGMLCEGEPHCENTWEWDGQTWHQITPAGPAPAGRIAAAMAFDARRARTVMFSGEVMSVTGATNDCGEGDSLACHDTWEWDGTAWSRFAASGPAPRINASMVYDVTHEQVLLFGGTAIGSAAGDCGEGSGEDCGYTWQWDGAQWTSVSTGGPQPRSRAVMAFDPKRGRTVLFGGFSDDLDCGEGTAGYCGHTWEWDGSAWQTVATTGPHERSDATLIATEDDGVLLWGGAAADCNGAGVTLCEHGWSWNGAAWNQVTTAGGVPSMRITQAAYDPGTSRTLIAAGDDGVLFTSTVGEAWGWNGFSWRYVDAPPPDDAPSLGSPLLAYDLGRSTTVLFGGFIVSGFPGSKVPVADTYERSGTAWSLVSSAGPEARFDGTLAWDPNRNRVLLFGGNAPADCGEGAGAGCVYTWEWLGSGWGVVATAGPTGTEVDMAYDPILDQMLLVVGGQTHTLETDTWVQLVASGSPCCELVTDSGRRRVLGLDEQSGTTADTWEWDGAAWDFITDVGPEGTRWAVAEHPPSKQILAFGGKAGFQILDETWTWSGNVGSRPAHLMQVSLREADFIATIDVSQITLTAFAGGSGAPSGVEMNGAQLWLWDQGRWLNIAQNPEPPGNPRILTAVIGDRETIDRTFIGDDLTLSVALVPAAFAGTGDSAVTTDYAEVAVEYRRP